MWSISERYILREVSLPFLILPLGSPWSILGSQCFIVFWVFLPVFLLPQKNRFICVLFFFFYRGFPGVSDGKVSACNTGDPGLIPGSGRFPGEGNGNPLHYSYLWEFCGQRLQSMGLQRHNWVTDIFTFISSCLTKVRILEILLQLVFFFFLNPASPGVNRKKKMFFYNIIVLHCMKYS